MSVSISNLDGILNEEDFMAVDAENAVVGFVGHGLNMQQALYENKGFRGIVRLFTIGEISCMFPGTQFINLNNIKEGEFLGSFRRASITIKAVKASEVYAFSGEVHTTTFLISSCAVIPEISNFVAKNSFKIGPNRVAYKSIPDRVKLLSSKTTQSPIC